MTAPSAAGASSGAREAPPPQNVDGIRLRGGLSLNGGLFVGVPRNPPVEVAAGPGASLALRFGIQLNHVLAVYYQGSAFIGAMQQSGTSGFGMAGIYNSVLGSLTIADLIEIAAGPSFDYAASLQCDAAMRVPCQTWSGGSIGGHGRFAILVGGRWPGVARRSGLAIGVDIHPMWQVDDATFLISATAGVGVDWY